MPIRIENFAGKFGWNTEKILSQACICKLFEVSVFNKGEGSAGLY